MAVALDPHPEPDHVAVERHRPPKRLDVVDHVVHATHEYTVSAPAVPVCSGGQLRIRTSVRRAAQRLTRKRLSRDVVPDTNSTRLLGN
jgi:hypothetical protein